MEPTNWWEVQNNNNKPMRPNEWVKYINTELAKAQNKQKQNRMINLERELALLTEELRQMRT